MSGTYTIRVLHISDVHFRSTEGALPQERILQVKREAWKRHRALGDAWAKNLDEIKSDGKPVDLVCFTGDIADWGLREEYVPATAFIKDLLAHLQIPREHLFIIPGNHDIHRKTEDKAWQSIRAVAGQVSAPLFSEWIAGGQPPFGVEPELRDAVLKRSNAYHEWVERDLGRPELLPAQSPHRRLGYYQKIELTGRPFPVYVVGLDSAWLAGDEHDAGKLRVTEDQVGILATDSGRSFEGFRIALIHHPLTDLADGTDVRRLLAEHVDLLLRGHQHVPLTEMWVDPERRLLELAAGCLYEGNEGHRYPNAFQVIDIVADNKGRPARYDIWFRGWSSHGGYWHSDSSLYRSARDGRLSLVVDKANFNGAVSEPKEPQDTAGVKRDAQKAIFGNNELGQSNGVINTHNGHHNNQQKSYIAYEGARVSLLAADAPRNKSGYGASRPVKRGNILGELTSEADRKMLESAFYESAVFHELLVGNDYRFVVGRRGAGKSALFQKVAEHLKQEAKVHLLTERPQEDSARALQGKLRKVANSYVTTRPITRLTWKVQILTAVAEKIRGHYKLRHLQEIIAFFDEYKLAHQQLFAVTGMERSLHVLETVLQPGVTADEIPRAIVKTFQLAELQKNIAEALQELGQRVVMLYDGLDEGWIPEAVETGVLGGLAKAAAELREADLPIHCTLFVRDNMLRALAYLDNDYTRHIEGSTLRLQWDEESLFRLVVKRLRAALGWQGEDMKVWNRFAQRELQGKEGFRNCLRRTLYRPRDVIALLNTAYQVAWQADRESIIETDLEATAALISRDRLNDLFKEYDQVLPGLQRFVSLFTARRAVDTFSNVQAMLDTVAEGPLSGKEGKDFALLGTGAEIFSALYSVGFLGVKDEGAESYRFCHDGSNADLRSLEPSRQIIIHPCYWKALEVEPNTAAETVLMRVDDSDDIAKKPTIKNELTDRRTKLLGDTVSELHKIRPGHEDAEKFGRWVHRAIQLLFGDHLEGVERKQRSREAQRRMIVATIKANSGVWARIKRVYGVQQCVFDVRNVEEIGASEFAEIFKRSAETQGRLMFVVRHGSDMLLKGLSKTEKRYVREGLKEHEKMIVILSASFLGRALSKMRNELKGDYAEDKLSATLSQLERG